MHLLNLTLGQFLAVFGSVSALTLALYLFDRSHRKLVVSTLRFWTAASQPTVTARRRRIQQPLSLILQLVSLALLLLAIAQLRFGAPSTPRDHILILDTSAWMAARNSNQTLMDLARDRARAYIRAVPAGDRVMLLRADALTTPATAFESDRSKLEDAIAASRPGATALSLGQAIGFVRQIQQQSGGRAGEVVIVSPGRISAADTGRVSLPNLRVLSVPDALENCGLRRVGVRRSPTDPDLWEILVSLRNYGSTPRGVALSLTFGPSENGPGSVPAGFQRLILAPGADTETTFRFRSRNAGFLVARILPHDAFPADDRVTLQLPAQPALRVIVYSGEPNLLRPVLDSSPRVVPVFRSPAQYSAHDDADLVILDRFHPPTPPSVDSIWIDPPSGSPIPVRSRVTNAPLTHWLADHPLGAGLRAHDSRLESAAVFEAGPDDLKIAEVAEGPVMVARPGKPKIVVLGFHPALSAMRYELSTPLLYANLLRWMAPGIFRRWELTAGTVGAVKVALDADVPSNAVHVLRGDGTAVPFTTHGQSLEFFSGDPGIVRVLAGDRENVYSLTLPQLGESKWTIPPDARRGIPRFSRFGGEATDLWRWLALAGAAGLLAEWILYGRLRRRAAGLSRRPIAMRKAS